LAHQIDHAAERLREDEAYRDGAAEHGYQIGDGFGNRLCATHAKLREALERGSGATSRRTTRSAFFLCERPFHPGSVRHVCGDPLCDSGSHHEPSRALRRAFGHIVPLRELL